ncbi:PREDICTED: uncharacterized protein LOC106819731 [Priapulus caudatus]|uniref:Uncharacterized protein LOC106819731 n=1 Tax=Priapulus caudatus TaxID=37621 RepID=A0ABM1F5U4_PRICU|nr:PREDICTED: uncharacterized protein LOC106819731 [Priapulus caudatus]
MGVMLLALTISLLVASGFCRQPGRVGSDVVVSDPRVVTWLQKRAVSNSIGYNRKDDDENMKELCAMLCPANQGGNLCLCDSLIIGKRRRDTSHSARVRDIVMLVSGEHQKAAD